MHALYARLYISVKVLKLLNSKLIIYLSIITNCYHPVAWDCRVLIPGREVVLAIQDNEQ